MWILFLLCNRKLNMKCGLLDSDILPHVLRLCHAYCENMFWRKFNEEHLLRSRIHRSWQKTTSPFSVSSSLSSSTLSYNAANWNSPNYARGQGSFIIPIRAGRQCSECGREGKTLHCSSSRQIQANLHRVKGRDKSRARLAFILPSVARSRHACIFFMSVLVALTGVIDRSVRSFYSFSVM